MGDMEYEGFPVFPVPRDTGCQMELEEGERSCPGCHGDESPPGGRQGNRELPRGNARGRLVDGV